MKDAMEAMKAELGDEAVILHSKKYKEGGLLGIGSREVVEITAAVEEHSLPKKIVPKLQHPTVVTRYKTDGTAQGVANAEQATQFDTLAEKNNPSNYEEPAQVEESQPVEEPAPQVDEPQAVEEAPQPVEEPQAVEEVPQPVEEPQAVEEAPPQVEEANQIEEPAPQVDDTKEVEETAPQVEEPQAVEEVPQPVEEPQAVEEVPQPEPEPTPQQQAIFTQEQLAQTQAMIMAQFNQMQMMQQAAIAQAQAQAAEQIRLQQQAQAQAQVQPVVQNESNPQNEEKIRRLEAEIAQMKALLTEVLGRDAKKGTVSLHEALRSQEVNEDILNEMAVQSTAGETLVDVHTPAAKATLIRYLNEHVKFSDGIKLNRHGVRIVALLGTTGVGKTTTLAKIAAKFVLEQKTDVALITADTYRISAVEQLKTYSDILELPLEIVYNPAELTSSLERHRDKDLILIDTAGRSQHNDYQMRELEEFLRVNPRIEKHLVISATTKFTDARHIMNKFAQVEPDKIIFTKIDETASLGMIINLLRDEKYSLSYITTGQSVPDDIERATADVLASLLLKKVDEV